MLHGHFTFNFFSLIGFICLSIVLGCINVKASFFEVEIEKPDSCYEVNRIEENKIYLERKSGCIAPQVIVSEKIKLKNWYDVLKIYIDGRFWKEISLKGMSPEAVLKAIEEAEKKAQGLGNFSNVYEKEAKEIAEKTYNMTQTQEFQKRVEQYKESLASMIMEKEGLSLKDVYKDYVEKKKKKKEKVLVLDPDERLYIFVSSSVPKETIRSYVTFVFSHIEGNVLFVLRGGVGGLKRLAPTIAWIYDMIKKNKFCEELNCEVYGVEFAIDPFLFRRYEIKKVPAVVYAKGKALTEFESSEGLKNKWETKIWVKTYGDVGLSYHLKVIGEELKIEKIKRFVDELNM
jgi:type-F conjugative transfer system pilin assembly protein TrbC